MTKQEQQQMVFEQLLDKIHYIRREYSGSDYEVQLLGMLEILIMALAKPEEDKTVTSNLVVLKSDTDARVYTGGYVYDVPVLDKQLQYAAHVLLEDYKHTPFIPKDWNEKLWTYLCEKPHKERMAYAIEFIKAESKRLYNEWRN